MWLYILSNVLGKLSIYVIPGIIICLVEYIILLKKPKYKHILPVLCFVYQSSS